MKKNSEGHPIERPVDFEYCMYCKHYEKSEKEEPCWTCLGTSTNTYSCKPINFEEVKKDVHY